MIHNNDTEIRKARPKGFTNMCRTQTPEIIYDSAVKGYLKGEYPDAIALSAQEFAQLYNIPYQIVAKRIKDGLASELLQGPDLRQTLEQERLKLLSSNLFRIGDSDAQLQRLTSYLSGRVLSHPKSWPDLIKELNSAIANRIKLTDTSFKAITLLNQTLASVPEEAQEAQEAPLSRDEVLELLASSDPNIDFSRYLEGTPNIAPHNLGTTQAKTAQLKIPEAHEFNSAREVDPVKIHHDIIVGPR